MLLINSEWGIKDYKKLEEGMAAGIYGHFTEGGYASERFLYIAINDDKINNQIILMPDLMLNITTITEKIGCFRKAKLQ